MITILFLMTMGIFLVLLFDSVESWIARAVLAGVVAAAWYFGSEPIAMAAGAILAVALLIRRQIPTVSRL